METEQNISPISKMNIFLSYGHDENEELVRLIKADLEKRGHDVWFDKNEIKFGDDWRAEITKGILKSNRFLSFLSKYSTIEPGVCLDEIAIAIGAKGGNIQTILVESEVEVKPPSSISHIQWLDMHDWKEKLIVGGKRWENWYQDKISEITRVVESEETKRFAGGIETLKECLKPISSDSRIAQLMKKGFVGRTWLFDDIDKWRNNSDRSSRLFWIMGSPGVGKSAFSAYLAHFGKDKVIAVQFCEYDKPDHRDARRIIRTLAFQIATRMPDYRKFLMTLPELKELDQKNHSELFDYLLANPLKNNIDGGRERYLLIIDALDEAAENGRNTLVELLAQHSHRLPDWIGIIVTSRPESNVKIPLQALKPYVFDTDTVYNLSDIRHYLNLQLNTILKERKDSEKVVEQIIVKSEGVFLYAESVCKEIKDGNLSLNELDKFPQGLGGIFLQFFQRQFSDLKYYEDTIGPALSVILAAREPLPVEILQKIFGWQETVLKKFIRSLGSMFIFVTENNVEVIKPYHKSFFDWLTDKTKSGSYFVSSKEGHRILVDEGWRQYSASLEDMNGYFLKWLPAHLVALDDEVRLTTLLKDFNFLMVKTKRNFLESLLEDYHILQQKYIADEKLLRIENAFFRENAHILRRGNDDWPAYKILLQLAVEHADNSPLTIGAEKWLNENKCDWIWLKNTKRPKDVFINPVLAVFEGHTDKVISALETTDENILSWSNDNTVRLWDKTGRLIDSFLSRNDENICSYKTKNHGIIKWNWKNSLLMLDDANNILSEFNDFKEGIVEIAECISGDIVIISEDNTVNVWSENGELKTTLKDRYERISFVNETFEEEKIFLASSVAVVWDKDWKKIYEYDFQVKDIWISRTNNNNVVFWTNRQKFYKWDIELKQFICFENKKSVINKIFQDKLTPFWKNSSDTSLKCYDVFEHEDGTIISFCVWDKYGNLIINKSPKKRLLQSDVLSVPSTAKSSIEILSKWNKIGYPLISEEDPYSWKDTKNRNVLISSSKKMLEISDELGNVIFNPLRKGKQDFNEFDSLGNCDLLGDANNFKLLDEREQKYYSIKKDNHKIEKIFKLIFSYFITLSSGNIINIWDSFGKKKIENSNRIIISFIGYPFISLLEYLQFRISPSNFSVLIGAYFLCFTLGKLFTRTLFGVQFLVSIGYSFAPLISILILSPIIFLFMHNKKYKFYASILFVLFLTNNFILFFFYQVIASYFPMTFSFGSFVMSPSLLLSFMASLFLLQLLSSISKANKKYISFIATEINPNMKGVSLHNMNKKQLSSIQTLWHSKNITTLVNLLKSGRIIITQEDRDLRALQVHSGNKPVTLQDLQKL